MSEIIRGIIDGKFVETLCEIALQFLAHFFGRTRIFFFSSELAGGTPHTVRCNIKVGLSIFFSSELAGGTPHTVRCNIEVGLTICSFFFFI